MWALILFCCLGVIPDPFVGACSSFPNYICCSSSNSSSEIFVQGYPPDNKNTMAKSDVTTDMLPKSLRILCFGDSLTAGYTSYGWEFHPYADHLRAGLQHALSTSDIEIDVAGLSGDQVQGSYLRRIKAKCANTETPYDWIIIMGGTNDLGWGQQPDTIYEGLSKPSVPLPFNFAPNSHLNVPFQPISNRSSLSILGLLQNSATANSVFIEKVWKVALDTGANVLALNVLEAAADREGSRRKLLNEKIASHQQER